MSTQPRRVNKVTAKRRAAARRRTREIGKYIFAYFIVGLLILSTVAVIFTPQTLLTPTVSPTPTALGGGLEALVTQGDQKVAEGDYDFAIGLYQAYLGQNPGNAEVNYKLGKAYLNKATPEVLAGVDYLQRAMQIAPDAAFAADAQGLLTQYAPVANQTATALAVLTGTVTVGIAGTLTPASTITSTGSPSVGPADIIPSATPAP
jgi:tetratricopeptide (TPR) repeat protein